MDHVRALHADRAKPHVLIEIGRAREPDPRAADVARIHAEPLCETIIAERVAGIAFQELDRLRLDPCLDDPGLSVLWCPRRCFREQWGYQPEPSGNVRNIECLPITTPKAGASGLSGRPERHATLTPRTVAFLGRGVSAIIRVTMAKGFRELIGRAMIDPDFLVDLQRAPDAMLAQYELSDTERATVLQALERLAKTPANQRAHALRTALIRRVAT